MSATYLSRAALDQLATAQRAIEQHLAGCPACGTGRPCSVRIQADGVFLRYRRLPRRTPGLLGAGLPKRSTVGWFDQP